MIRCLPVFLLLGCPSDDDTDPADTDLPVATVMGTFTVGDLFTGDPLSGAELTMGSTSAILDADGRAVVDLPDATPFVVRVTAEEYPALALYGVTDGEDIAMTRFIPDYGTLGLFGTFLGTTYDDTRGIVSVVVVAADGAGGLLSLPGATIELGNAYELALVNDSASTIGFSEGNTTLEGSSSAVLFVNTATGPTTVTVTPPSGYTCALLGGDVPVAEAGLMVSADTFATISVVCAN